MTYRKLYSSLPKMKESHAISVADHIISTKQTTRKDIANAGNISLMSATKAASLLFDSALVNEREKKCPKTNRMCGYLSLAKENNFIIVDVSSSAYKMICVDGELNTVCEYSYKYQSIFSELDNLRIFCERGYTHLHNNLKCYSGLCVLTPDSYSLNNDLNSLIGSNFRRSPDKIISLCDAISRLRISAADPHLPCNSLFYLNISDNVSSYFVKKDISIKCDVPKLILKNRKSAAQAIRECISASELAETVFDIFNCASAMLDPSVFILESDRFILGASSAANFAQKLKATFDDKRKLVISDKRPHFYIKGAACELIRQIIVDILS